MLEGGKISGRQAVFLLITTIVPTSILFLPHLVYKTAKQDSWLSIIFMTIFGLAGGNIIGRLGERFPRQTIVEYSRELVGPFLGKVIGLLYAGTFVYFNAFILREFSELLTTNFFAETPQVVFIISTVFLTVYMVRHGLEVLARVNDMVIPLVLFMIGLIAIFAVHMARPENLFPVLENGMLPVLKGAVPGIAPFFLETFIMLVLASFLVQPFEARSVITKAVLSIGALQLLIILAIIAVLGTLTANMLFPTLNLVRHVRLAPFLLNIDPIILLLWVTGGVVKVAIFHYCATIATAQLLQLNNRGPVSIAIGAIMFILSNILWEDSVELAHQIANVVQPFFFLIQFGIPLLLLITAVIRKKGETR